MAEIDNEALRISLFELMKWVCSRDLAGKTASDILADQIRTRISRALRVQAQPVVEEPLPAPKAPMKHDWREYRSDDPAYGCLRGFMCARCGSWRSWPVHEFPRDVRATGKLDERPCVPECVVWIDESPLKEIVSC